MTIIGVECARRRTPTFHGRSSLPPRPSSQYHHHRRSFHSSSSLVTALPRSQLDCPRVERSSVPSGSVLTLPRGSPPSSTTRLLRTGCPESEIGSGVVSAARNRLDERFRPAVHVSRRCTGSPPSDRHAGVTESNMQRTLIAWAPKTGDLNSSSHLERKMRKDDKEDDCPVCLETFMAGEDVIVLPCEHGFHRHCLIPWLESHCQCPCCRTNVAVSTALRLAKYCAF